MPEPTSDESDLPSFDDTTVKERHSTTHWQVTDIQNTRKDSELIGTGSDFIEKAEIEDAFLRDKEEEAGELYKRMIETSKQVEALKADVERLKVEVKTTTTTMTNHDNLNSEDGYYYGYDLSTNDTQPLQPNIPDHDRTGSTYTYNTTQYFTFEQHMTQSFTNTTYM